jgi:hypothetical protein
MSGSNERNKGLVQQSRVGSNISNELKKKKDRAQSNNTRKGTSSNTLIYVRNVGTGDTNNGRHSYRYAKRQKGMEIYQ